MVIVATREVVPVFTWYATVIVPLPVPEGVTLHHGWSLVVVHATLEITSKLIVPEDDETF